MSPETLAIYERINRWAPLVIGILYTVATLWFSALAALAAYGLWLRLT